MVSQFDESEIIKVKSLLGYGFGSYLEAIDFKDSVGGLRTEASISKVERWVYYNTLLSAIDLIMPSLRGFREVLSLET